MKLDRMFIRRAKGGMKVGGLKYSTILGSFPIPPKP